MKTEYLGDGVYATCYVDGVVMLTTGHHDSKLADNVIFIEPEIAQQLMKILKEYE